MRSHLCKWPLLAKPKHLYPAESQSNLQLWWDCPGFAPVSPGETRGPTIPKTQGGCFPDSTDSETSVKAMALHRQETTTGSGDSFLLDIFWYWMFLANSAFHLHNSNLTGCALDTYLVQEKTCVLSQLFEFSWFPFLCFCPLCWSVCSSPLLLQNLFSLT